MWRHYDVVHLEQRVVLIRRLLGKHVEARGGDPPVREGLDWKTMASSTCRGIPEAYTITGHLARAAHT
jgi:hypothetical protein